MCCVHIARCPRVIVGAATVPVRHVESAATRFAQLDKRGAGHLRSGDVERYANSVSRALAREFADSAEPPPSHAFRWRGFAWSNLCVNSLCAWLVCRLMPQVFEHTVVAQAARRIAKAKKAAANSVEVDGVSQEDFVTGMVAFMGQKPSIDEQLEGMFASVLIVARHSSRTLMCAWLCVQWFSRSWLGDRRTYLPIDSRKCGG